MSIKSITSPFVHTWQGLGFWSGTRHRHLLIMSLSPAKESRFTEFFINLCVIVNFFLPLIAIYFLSQSLSMRQDPQAAPFVAVLLSISIWLFGVVGFSFYQRVLVWPKLARNPREMAELFDDSSYGLLAMPGIARWKLFGLSLGQVAITGVALYSTGSLRNGVLLIAICLAIWLPAAISLILATKVIKGVFADNATFSDADRVLMGMRLTTDLTAVMALVVGFVVFAAFTAIYLAYLAVLVIGALILWRSFATQTDPVNTAGLFDASAKQTTHEWRDTSGLTHIDGEGRITEAHTGSLIGTVDEVGRVTRASGGHVGQIDGDGKLN